MRISLSSSFFCSFWFGKMLRFLSQIWVLRVFSFQDEGTQSTSGLVLRSFRQSNRIWRSRIPLNKLGIVRSPYSAKFFKYLDPPGLIGRFSFSAGFFIVEYTSSARKALYGLSAPFQFALCENHQDTLMAISEVVLLFGKQIPSK
jgi:hypothetical protein